ncbi:MULTISPECIES: hypothetical protein [Pantoea]|jgi:tetratricopeptide (TPR) repeat protein|uniref:Tetratricopeptide repeat protein n=1 Tax=Pantoea sp. BJ2 TaxID=3141322 RepID=A0AAU7U1N4_9GAMM|nr:MULTISPECIES: hypothetical protein [unclassified Pantoea]MBD9658784.1 hypothetical protein [Pantoea sp. PNT03]MBY4951164.1 hypothetical protein [Pantoea sp. DY-17]MDY0926864.1 hypothetical protein [Enterobacter sp. CFBP8995]PYG51814.1 hypothetical protein DEU53_101876 [Pantoea sp. AG1095]
MEFHRKNWHEKAFDLANRGISLGSLGEHQAAACSWGAAAELAKAHLRDDDIYFWIMSGYGAILIQCQRYQEAIEAAKEALDWEAQQNQILSRMTLARALYALGAVDGAKFYFQQIYDMQGDGIFAALPEFEHATLKDLVRFRK